MKCFFHFHLINKNIELIMRNYMSQWVMISLSLYDSAIKYFLSLLLIVKNTY